MLTGRDFRCVSKVENVLDRRRSTVRLFQERGPATFLYSIETNEHFLHHTVWLPDGVNILFTSS